MKYFQFIDNQLKWTILAKLGRSRIVSATILMPLIGYFLFFNDQVISVFSLSAEFLGIETDLALERTLNSLRMLYIGLGSMALASIAFKVFCPSSINESGSYASFINLYLPLVDQFVFERLKKEIKSSGPCVQVEQEEIDKILAYEAPIEDKYTAANPLNTSQLSAPRKSYEKWMNENRVGFTNLLRVRFQQEDCARYFWRWVIAIFYAVGFGFVLWPSLKMFLTVVSATEF